MKEMEETWVQSLGREYPLEKEMATHSSILAWRISWTEEPGGLQSGVAKSQTFSQKCLSFTISILLLNDISAKCGHIMKGSKYDLHL